MDDSTSRPEVLAERLADAIQRSGLTKSAFADQAGVDRTTLSQLLSRSNRRQPRVDTLRQVASAHQLSIDWLVGLSNTGPLEAALLAAQTSFEAPGPSPVDELLLDWLIEAVDYKIRYIPTTLPDLLKSERVIRFERSGSVRAAAAESIDATAAQLAWARHPDTVLECCSPTQSIHAFARGESIWRRLGVDARREQLERMIALTDELYPTFRWFLYDGSARYAAPLTVFGTKRAALYLGGLYLALTSDEQVRALSRHFDGVVRDATVQPTSMPRYLTRLLRQVT